MNVPYIIVPALYLVFLFDCVITNDTYRKTWNEAVDYCKTKHDGTLSTISEIKQSTFDIWNNVWIRSIQITKWLSYEGCYSIDIMETSITFDQDFDGRKRCSESCNTERIAIQENRRCVCLSADASHKVEWRHCDTFGNESNFVVYRKYRNEDVLKKSPSRGKNARSSDSERNCVAFNCKKKTSHLKACKQKIRILCSDSKRSNEKLNWKEGVQYCSNKGFLPQSFEKNCQNDDGTFRTDNGLLWIGMYRPVALDKTLFEECTYTNTSFKKGINCTKRLPFFCTGPDGLVHSSSQRRQNPSSTGIPPNLTENPMTSPKKTSSLNGLIIDVRTKRNEKHILLQKGILVPEHKTPSESKVNIPPNDREKHDENIYEFEEIEDEEDSQMVSCRNLTVECPLPCKDPGAARILSSCLSSVPIDLPSCSSVDQERDNTLETSNDTETGGQRNHIKDSGSSVGNEYDSFSILKAGKNVEPDLYDHAKVVPEHRRKDKTHHEERSVLKPDNQSEKNNTDFTYDMARGIEHEYDEFWKPNKCVVISDSRDSVASF
ncbi:uncharacterized protein LOC132543176 [Ylistrum balloti]|uniref:uncharacterized protein LOC132543176 n=1 Tax=Ylistrum balloti TaxID=509963 RepID=UPI002905BBEA|nr:uncharacterized protein LOC132543176 [Ylistrum balloti]